ncbi:MAG: hypothetical protein WA919_30145 [Coleofasciculaceae cyanobacterium]
MRWTKNAFLSHTFFRSPGAIANVPYNQLGLQNTLNIEQINIVWCKSN